MHYVILLILGLVILILSLSFYEDDNNSTVNPIVEKKEVIQTETKEDLLNKGFIKVEEPKPIEEVKEDKQASIQPVYTPEQTPEFIVAPGFFVSVKDWKLSGQQKNILTVFFDVNNGLNESIKNERKVISCQAFYNDTLLETVEVVHNFNIRRLSLTKLELNFGYVDIDTNKIVCVMQDFIEPEPTLVKPLNKPIEKKSEIKDVFIEDDNKKESYKEVVKDGFIIKEKVEDEDSILLPPL